jgi:glutathione peroxidase-family protein
LKNEADICKVTLYLGPNFAQILVSSPIECKWKVREIRYNSMKLVITSQGLILTRFDSMKSISSSEGTYVKAGKKMAK